MSRLSDHWPVPATLAPMDQVGHTWIALSVYYVNGVVKAAV